MHMSDDTNESIIGALHQLEEITEGFTLEDSPTSSDIVAQLRPWRDLKDTDEPLMPIPSNYIVPDIAEIHRHTEKRCGICAAPIKMRKLLEGVYLESGKKPMEVKRFFEKYYNVAIRYDQVATHMTHHCDLSRVVVSGLRAYENSDEWLSKWRFRERDLALTAVMMEMNDIKGMDCKGGEAMLRRAGTMDRLANTLMRIQKERDESANAVVNWWEVLRTIHNKITDPESKEIVRKEIEKVYEKVRSRS